MRVLGIESSCDETGVAIYDTERGLLGHRLHSQIDLHAAYGGVVPELASRDHIRRLPLLLRELLEATGLAMGDIDGIVYTCQWTKRAFDIIPPLFNTQIHHDCREYKVTARLIRTHFSTIDRHLLDTCINPELSFVVVGRV